MIPTVLTFLKSKSITDPKYVKISEKYVYNNFLKEKRNLITQFYHTLI